MYLRRCARFAFFCMFAMIANNVFALSAGLSSQYKYDSNLYKTASNKVSDSIMNMKFNAGQSVMPGEHSFSANYELLVKRHITRVSEDAVFNNFALGYQSNPKRFFVVKAKSNYTTGVNERGELDTNTVDLSAPDTWKSTKSDVRAEYLMLENLKLTGIFTQQSRKYDLNSSKLKDAKISAFSLKSQYAYSGRTSFLSEVKLSNNQFPYTPDNNSYSTNFIGGIQWKNTGKLISYFNAGWTIAKVPNNPSADTNGLLINASINWIRKSYSRVTFGFGRSITDKVQANNLTYVNNWFDVSLVQSLSHQVLMSIKGKMIFNQPQLGNDEVIYSMSPSITVTPKKWFYIKTLLQYSQKKSTNSGLNYSGTEASLALGIRI